MRFARGLSLAASITFAARIAVSPTKLLLGADYSRESGKRQRRHLTTTFFQIFHVRHGEWRPRPGRRRVPVLEN